MSTWHKSMCSCRLSLIESRFFSKSQWHIRAGLIKQWKLSKLSNTGKLKCKLDAWFQEFSSGQPATRQNISPLPPQVGKSSKPSQEPVFQAPLKMTTSVDENHESEGGVGEPLQQLLQALRNEKLQPQNFLRSGAIQLRCSTGVCTDQKSPISPFHSQDLVVDSSYCTMPYHSYKVSLQKLVRINYQQ